MLLALILFTPLLVAAFFYYRWRYCAASDLCYEIAFSIIVLELICMLSALTI